VDQLLIALDVESGARALALADALRGAVGGFKIGNRLFTAEGPAIVRALADRGDRVFLDLKYRDIPNTVATAVAAATSLGAWMVNVHTAGGLRMMQAAADAARTTAAAAGRQPPLVIGVTVLTSMNAEGLAEVGIGIPVVAQVERLARLARDAGLDGVVASPQETSHKRRACGDGLTIVTPGHRGGAAASAKDDQERTMTAGEAVRAGASYLVVGRPIIGAPDPREAAERIGAEIRAVVVQ
jgi:orotidine-5'-phosphate decarboxylase